MRKSVCDDCAQEKRCWQYCAEGRECFVKRWRAMQRLYLGHISWRRVVYAWESDERPEPRQNKDGLQ